MERTVAISLIGRAWYPSTIPGNIKRNVFEQSVISYRPATIEETIEELAEELPLAGDYSGIGGPDSVPLESDGAFEKPMSMGNAYSFLTELFMAPSDDTVFKFQVTEKKRLIAK